MLCMDRKLQVSFPSSAKLGDWLCLSWFEAVALHACYYLFDVTLRFEVDVSDATWKGG